MGARAFKIPLDKGGAERGVQEIEKDDGSGGQPRQIPRRTAQ
jgi:hypothetical protein